MQLFEVLVFYVAITLYLKCLLKNNETLLYLSVMDQPNSSLE